MIVFDGNKEANRRKIAVRAAIGASSFIHKPTIFALVFSEDIPSKVYTRLKKKDAISVGIAYHDIELPISTSLSEIFEIIHKANADSATSGIIIQKPAKNILPNIPHWWEQMAQLINPKKDLDGLNPQSGIIPATAQAILCILEIACQQLSISLQGKRVAVLGKSEIVGVPLAKELKKKKLTVDLFGKREFLAKKSWLTQADIIISATGQSNLISLSMIKKRAILIDAGSPNPEINPLGLEKKAVFLSPVPGGVGPMTRICLLENLVFLLQLRK